MRPSLFASPALRIVAALAFLAPAVLRGQSRPVTDSARVTTPRAAADTDTTTHPAGFVPKSLVPFQLDLQLEGNVQRFQNLRCTSLELFQASTSTSCNGKFADPSFPYQFALKSAGTIKDRLHINVDYDQRREFEASQILSAYYEDSTASVFRRVDLGNINFATPPSRFITSSLPTGNYGFQVTSQIGRLRLQSIFAKQAGNVVQSKVYYIGDRTQQHTERDVEDFQVERLRFFFTIDPALFGRAYPNIDILNRGQLLALSRALPDTLRPTRVVLYRLRFGAQPRDPRGPRLHVRGDPSKSTQTYDVLREGSDYYIDPSLLWFALVSPLDPLNERLVVAYNVRVNGRDTVYVNTGGTPDLKINPNHEQVANLVMDPSVGPSSAAFRNEIRSAYQVEGPRLVRPTTHVRVVTGSGYLEHPLAGSDATFLQMFGLAQRTNPAEFDYENRLWPRRGDPPLDLGAGAADVRNGQSIAAQQIIPDYFLVFPSLHPFSQRDTGLVTAGNPTNDQIYSIPGEYLNSVQHPASVYRLHFTYEMGGVESYGSLALGATQMRPGSERIYADGRPLIRDLDYHIDYDIGLVSFTRPDTLFRLRRRIEASYEDNPVFGGSPTALMGVVSQLPVSHGLLTFTAINQQQGNAADLTRPLLGLQGSSMATAGATAQFSWDAPFLTRLVSRLPFGETKTPSRFSLTGEIAGSQPQFGTNAGNTAFVEPFETDGGFPIPLNDISWEYSSLPAYGHTLRSQFGGSILEPARASTLVWQSNVRNGSGSVFFRESDIDPLLKLVGSGNEPAAPVLWLTLLPLDQAGAFQPATRHYNWTVGNTPLGRRWRSMRAVLAPSGVDLTTNEKLQFWALVDTSTAGRQKNPALVFDFGDVSENSLVYGPDTLEIRHNNTTGTIDSLFFGRRLQNFDSLDTERDAFLRSFNADVNDTGLPGDVVDTLIVKDGASVTRQFRVRICAATTNLVHTLGDPNTNCTVGNKRLDEEDIDLDNALNFDSSQRENERLLRYVVDLSDASKFSRVGKSYTDTLFVSGVPQVRTRQWVFVDIPFKTPTDSLNDVNRRRIRSVRLTVVSGAQQGTEEPTQFPIAELRVTGAPWLNRSTQTLAGIGNVRPDGGFVITSTIGTNDSSTTFVYQSPPGTQDEASSTLAQFAVSRTVINERSMRIQAGSMGLYHRAEAFTRFPNGPQFYLGYKELHVWGRGRGNGWGQNGDLQMYMKIGRDENNFYMRRAPANAGTTQAAWSDVVLDFSRLTALQLRIQQAYLAGKKESIMCTGVDSALVVATPLPIGVIAHRWAACEDGYMVYTIDPAVSAPNLGAVQELAVGIVRVSNTGGASPVLPGDTLELWVDDIRLKSQVSNPGYAGQVTGTLNFADFGDVRFNLTNRDPNFRQVGDQPTFLGQRNVDLAMTLQLQRFLPRSFGFALPLTITKTSQATDPFYLSRSDIAGGGIPGLRKPKNDLTTYSLSMRRAAPVGGGILGEVVNNLGVNATYVTGVDRTEFQDGNAHNLGVSLDYLVTPDSGHTLQIPLIGLGATPLRWNPTQFRVTSGIVRGDDKRVSFLTPSTTIAVAPATTTASSRLWRNGSVLEFRPTASTSARWEMESLRDFRDYRDSALAIQGVGPRPITVDPGFERERTIVSSFAIAPMVSAWLHPRADFATQYSMLRDPNVRSFTPLPGVTGVDSVLAARDSQSLSRLLALPRRMTAAQTGSVGAQVDLAAAFTAYTRDSSAVRRLGGLFAPIDVSYTRSLLTALDAASAAAPLPLQFGLGGPGAFRTVNGVAATTAGQTGTLSAQGSLLLPFSTAFSSAYRRTTTQNWVARPDSSIARVDGDQTQFPDVALTWKLRPAAAFVANVDASAGYIRNTSVAALPSFLDDAPPELHHFRGDRFPLAAAVTLAGRPAFRVSGTYAYHRQSDSLPGSIARTHGNDLGFDTSVGIHLPQSLNLGIRNDVRTRFEVRQTNNNTIIVDPNGTLSGTLLDNGRLSYNTSASADVSDAATFTVQGSYVVNFDNTLNHRFAQTIFSVVYQLHMFGTGK